MNRIRTFQALIIASAALYLGYFFLPYMPVQRSFEMAMVLEMNGHGGNPLVLHPAIYMSFLAAKIISTVGLLLFLTWGRWVLVASVALGMTLIPFGGAAALPPLDNLLNGLIYLSEGVLIGIAFSSPLSECFGGGSSNAPAES